ncbi:MAG: anhydro-N-acetylmuramic acid kinase, partial [Hymenobacter sp.]
MQRQERPGNLTEVERQLTLRHVAAVQEFLRNFDIAEKNVDFIGFHGQTVLHR